MTTNPFSLPTEADIPPAGKPLTPNALIATAREKVNTSFAMTDGELSHEKLILQLARALEDSQQQLVDALSKAAPAGVSYDTTHITSMLTNACDEIQELAQGNELVEDVTNLMVNAALHYLVHPGDELNDVVETNYDGHFRCDEECDDECDEADPEDSPLYRIQEAA